MHKQKSTGQEVYFGDCRDSMGKIQALLIQDDEDSWRGENDCRCAIVETDLQT